MRQEHNEKEIRKQRWILTVSLSKKPGQRALVSFNSLYPYLLIFHYSSVTMIKRQVEEFPKQMADYKN